MKLGLKKIIYGRHKTKPLVLSGTQELFCEWNADRLSIDIRRSRERYLGSLQAISGGHGGKEYRAFCDLSYAIFRPFADDNQEELFQSYQFYGPMHFFRLLASAEPDLNEHSFLLNELEKQEEIRILDFGCGLAHLSRTLARNLIGKGHKVHLVLADIPTLRKDFLLWLGKKTGIPIQFLDCTKEMPLPELPPQNNLCIATEVFEHLPDPASYFEVFHSALADKGFIYTNIRDHHEEYMHISPDLSSVRRLIKEYKYKEIRPDILFQKTSI